MIGLLAQLVPLGLRLAGAYEARQKATTDAERIAADERIAALEARASVQRAEAGSPVNALMRAALAAPVAILLAKILVWDKALGQWTGGTTDALSPELWGVVEAVIGFYLLSEAAVRVAGVWRR